MPLDFLMYLLFVPFKMTNDVNQPNLTGFLTKIITDIQSSAIILDFLSILSHTIPTTTTKYQCQTQIHNHQQQQKYQHTTIEGTH